jgi:isopentenyl-diphosphate delta-isomerase
MRAVIEDPKLITTYQVRQFAPDILLMANLGAVQLNYGFDIKTCAEAVEMVEADALILHLNPLQEALQPEGDTDFRDLLPKIEKVCKAIEVPVIVKEVGWGIGRKTAKRLVEVGVTGIDVAGAGGTSWSQVEMHRADSEIQAKVAGAFGSWGIPTSVALQQIRENLPDILLIASGGLRNGIDIAKCIGLGADAGGMAGPYLKAALNSTEAVGEVILQTAKELQIAMFAAGIPDLASLKNTRRLNRSTE